MPQRIAAVMSFVVFTVCLLAGGFVADNSFPTAVSRALVAMVVTLIVGLLVGWMGQKMIDENIKQRLEVEAHAVAPIPAARTAPGGAAAKSAGKKEPAKNSGKK